MAEPPQADSSVIRFAEKIMALLNQGQFTATYKYAVLLGLMDLCMERVSRTGAPPTSLTTRQLAEKIVELYWPHTIEYPGTEAVLRQNQGRAGTQARIVSLISSFRKSTSFISISRARRMYDATFRTLVRKVEWKLIEMPLPRLQVIGEKEDRFIYEISWKRNEILGNAKDFRREVVSYQRGELSSFDNAIRLKPDAAHALLALNTLLRPFIHAGWAAKVAQINRLDESRLSAFLFDAGRVALGPVRAGLVEIQHAECFYCGSQMRTKIEVDHFIPWSRYPDNRIDNLVAAHSGCNRQKLDFLAADQHIEKWRARNENSDLGELAAQEVWERDLEATEGVARSIYLGLPDGSPLWVEGDEFEESVRTQLRAALT